MASKKNRARVSKDPNPRKYKKKVSPLVTDKVTYVDYKDVDLLTRFISDRAKIRNRRVSGNDVQQQREVANAIKVAREMFLDRHYVVHTHDPKFTLELTPDYEAPDKVGKGVIKRICVPNSWAGDYGQYAKMLTAAQDFFVQSGSGPTPRT